jgi:hypothetical protein
MMPKLICALVASLCLASASVLAAETQPPARAKPAAPAKSVAVDSQQIEKDLQHLSWKQFRAVIEAVPKMKADVDAHGPMGWKFVQASYTTHAWKKNIDKLDDAQRKRLADLVQAAKSSR